MLLIHLISFYLSPLLCYALSKELLIGWGEWETLENLLLISAEISYRWDYSSACRWCLLSLSFREENWTLKLGTGTQIAEDELLSAFLSELRKEINEAVLSALGLISSLDLGYY